jgi:hypothetical protein
MSKEAFKKCPEEDRGPPGEALEAEVQLWARGEHRLGLRPVTRKV